MGALAAPRRGVRIRSVRSNPLATLEATPVAKEHGRVVLKAFGAPRRVCSHVCQHGLRQHNTVSMLQRASGSDGGGDFGRCCPLARSAVRCSGACIRCSGVSDLVSEVPVAGYHSMLVYSKFYACLRHSNFLKVKLSRATEVSECAPRDPRALGPRRGSTRLGLRLQKGPPVPSLLPPPPSFLSRPEPIPAAPCLP